MVRTKSANVSLERSQPVPRLILRTPSSTENCPSLTISQPSRSWPLKSGLAEVVVLAGSSGFAGWTPLEAAGSPGVCRLTAAQKYAAE